jgi:hypothetical protein
MDHLIPIIAFVSIGTILTMALVLERRGSGQNYVDPSNQVRHFTFYLGAGWGMGSTLANRGLYRAGKRTIHVWLT